MRSPFCAPLLCITRPKNLSASARFLEKSICSLDRPAASWRRRCNTRDLGDQHGVDGSGRVLRRLRGGPAVQDQQTEGAPRLRLKLRLDQFQQSPQQTAVFAVPLRRSVHLQDLHPGKDTPRSRCRRGGRLIPRFARQKRRRQWDRYGPQPGAETAPVRLVLELRQLPHDDAEDFLRQIVEVGGLQIVPPQPGMQDGVYRKRAAANRRRWPGGSAVQQAERTFHHGRRSRGMDKKQCES